ncbi:MAG: AAA family ATPase [Myxococcales bacterium]|nr:AAA family ATPase [Myxococcales bacterium]
MASFQLKFSSPVEFLRFWSAAAASRSAFVPTTESPDMGELVALEFVVGLKRQQVEAEVESVESDEQGRPGVRVAFSVQALNAVGIFERTFEPAPLDDEPPTGPGLLDAEPLTGPGVLEPEPPTGPGFLGPEPATKPGGDVATPPQASVATPAKAGPRIDVAKPVPATPQQASVATPAKAGPRIDAAKPEPATPQQTSLSTPAKAGPRIDAAKPVSVTPQQPSASTPSSPGLRIDAAKPMPVTPQQPSVSTPSRPGLRIDAARPLSLDASPPAEVLPRPSSESGLRRPIGPLVTAPPPQPLASAPPPATLAPLPSMSAPRPLGSTAFTAAFIPGALAPRNAVDGRVGRIGELMGKLGFPLSPERVARFEQVRAALPASMPIAWLLGVEWVRASTPQRLSELVTLLTDVSLNNGGALDAIDTSGATVVFFGLGSQGACVLAAQELRERLEALADGRPDAPSLKLAVAGSRLHADPELPVEGDGLSQLASMLRRAQPGQCLLARNLALGVSDLVGTTAAQEDVQLTSRKPVLVQGIPSVGLEPLHKLLELRVTALEHGMVAPLVVTGPRRSGRTHLAQEFARRAHTADTLVGFTSSLRGDGHPLSSLAELVCQLCQVPFEARHEALGPAMDALGVAPIRREAMLVALQLLPTPAPFSARQVVDALRLLLAELSKGRRRVLVFDGLDQADAGSIEVVRELLQTPTRRELVVALTTAEQAATLPVEGVLTLPSLSAAEVDGLLTTALGVAPPELRDALLMRTRGLPGLVVDLLLLSIGRGALRPRGESLALEGAVPNVSPEQLPKERLAAEGARCGQLLEAVWLLGERTDAAAVAQVLPGLAQELWPRAVVSRVLVGTGQGRASVAGAFEGLVASTTVSGPGLAMRALTALQTSGGPSLANATRIAMLLERAQEPQKAGTQWREVAARAAATRDFERSARAQEGMARVLRRHPQRDSGVVLSTRLQLWSRVAATRLTLGDLAGARRALNEGLDAHPRGAPPDAELSFAQSKVLDAEGKADEAREALSEALACSKNHPARAAVLAALAQACEARNDNARAQDSWHQALAAADPFLPLAAWFGEVDFRGRVEARIGALFIVENQPGRARTWLVSSSERFKVANAPLHAARVMANLGALSMQTSAFGEATQWFSVAASTAEAGGDFLFQARQLVSLVKVLVRQADPRATEVATVALGLAEALAWDDGVKALQAVLGA